MPSKRSAAFVFSLLLLSGCASTELDRISAKRSEINRLSNAEVCDGYNKAKLGGAEGEWLDFYQVALEERFRGESMPRDYCLEHAARIVEREKKENRARWSTEGEENISDQNSGYVKPGKY